MRTRKVKAARKIKKKNSKEVARPELKSEAFQERQSSGEAPNASKRRDICRRARGVMMTSGETPNASKRRDICRRARGMMPPPHREQYKFGSIGTHRDHEEASGTVFVVESTTFEDQREFLHAGG
jgi:hypothetical protein